MGGLRFHNWQLGFVLGVAIADILARVGSVAVGGHHDRPVRLVRICDPEVPTEGKIDLVAFHQREHRRYFLAAITLFIVALGLNFALWGGSYYVDWWRDSVFSLTGLALALLAFVIKARWTQVFSAIALAVLATYYMIVTCNIVAA